MLDRKISIDLLSAEVPLFILILNQTFFNTEECVLEKEIYLDNSATTRVCEEAAQKALEMMTEFYGNPSSLHSKGLEPAEQRETIRRFSAQ